MKDTITALAALPSLEPLLALERCAEIGDTFDCGETLGVRPEGDTQVLHPAGSPADILVVGELVGDTMTIYAAVSHEQLPEHLHTCLRLLGTTAKGNIGAGAGIDLEQFIDRIQGLQHVAIVARFVEQYGLGPVEETVEALLTAARTLRARRDAVFELQNTASTRARTLAGAEKQLQEALASVAGLQQTLGHAAVLHMLSDPRGVALEIEEVATGRRLGLTGASVTWSVPETIRPSTRKRGAGVQMTAAVSARNRDAAGFAPSSKTNVDPDVIAALQSAVATGHQLAISERLSPRTYAKVKALLCALGGRWSSGRQAHIFAGDAGEMLRNILGGAVVTDRDWEYFPTPKAVVDRMLAKANVQPGWRVREPQAGQGAIALPLAAIVGIDNVDCTEAMPQNAQRLRELGFTVREGDFLQETPAPRYDAILMNPPFSAHRDVAHITHALGFLRAGGVLVSIASPSWRHAGNSKAEAFRQLLSAADAEVDEIPTGAFRASGTDIATVMITIRLPDANGVKDAASQPSADQNARRATAPAAQLELFL